MTACARCRQPVEDPTFKHCEVCRAWHAARKRRLRAGIKSPTSAGIGQQHMTPRGELAVDTFTLAELAAYRAAAPAIHRVRVDNHQAATP